MNTIEEIIDQLHIQDLKNEMHPSFFDENDDYNMLIVRLPTLRGELNLKSIGFIFTQQSSYLYNKETKVFEDMGDRFEGVYKKINKSFDLFLKKFRKYDDAIEDMEERLYENSTTDSFMRDWLDLKRDLLRIERVLSRTAGTMDEFIDFYENSDEFPVNSYVNIHEHMERAMRYASLYLSKLDYIYSFYTARTNEKMNKMIYILTIISAVFLPLNLVVGFFGMNTSGLPLVGGSDGTLRVTLIIASLFVITSAVVYLWKGKTDKSL